MRDDELDLLIGSALSTYAEPRPRLEDRVLARLTDKRQLKRTGSRRSWLLWAMPLPLAACFILLLTISTKRQAHSNVAPQTYEQYHHPMAKVQGAPRETLLAPPRRRPKGPQPERSSESTRTVSVPKLDVFPSPRPPSEQEKALAALASLPASPVAQQVPSEGNGKNEKGLEISSIRIPSITMPEQGKN